jgi:hypothetical protein
MYLFTVTRNVPDEKNFWKQQDKLSRQIYRAKLRDIQKMWPDLVIELEEYKDIKELSDIGNSAFEIARQIVERRSCPAWQEIKRRTS